MLFKKSVKSSKTSVTKTSSKPVAKKAATSKSSSPVYKKPTSKDSKTKEVKTTVSKPKTSVSKKLPYDPADYEFKFDKSLEGFELQLARYWTKKTGKRLDYSNTTEVGDAFMEYVADVLRGNGYTKVVTTGKRADGGLDIKCVLPSEDSFNLFSEDLKIAVQCKFHNKGNASTKDVQHTLAGFMKLKGAHRGFLITTSPDLCSDAKIQFNDYNRHAKEQIEVEKNRLEFIGSKKLRKMINTAVKNGKKDLWV